MSALDFTILDLDFPVGSQNKTAVLVAGEQELLLVDAGFTRADGHRLVAAILDSGKTLTTVFLSHGDPDFYFGAEVIADAFPEARFVATPPVLEHIEASYEGKLGAWAALGKNLPTRLVKIEPLTGDLTLEGQLFELKGGSALCRTVTTSGRRRSARSSAVSSCSSRSTSGWLTPRPRRTGPRGSTSWTRWPLSILSSSYPATGFPGRRRTPARSRRPGSTSSRSRRSWRRAADGAALTATLVERYPNHGMLIAAQIGAKVATGEMTWGH